MYHYGQIRGNNISLSRFSPYPDKFMSYPPFLIYNEDNKTRKGPFLIKNGNKFTKKYKIIHQNQVIRFKCSTHGCGASVNITILKLSDNRNISEFEILKSWEYHDHPNNFGDMELDYYLSIREILLMHKNDESFGVTYRRWSNQNPGAALCHPRGYASIKSVLDRYHKKQIPNIVQVLNIATYCKKYQSTKIHHNTHYHRYNLNPITISKPTELPKLLDIKINRITRLNQINHLQNDILQNNNNNFNRISEYDVQFYQGNDGTNDFHCWFTKRFILLLKNMHTTLCDATFYTPKSINNTNNPSIPYLQFFSASMLWESKDPKIYVNKLLPSLWILMKSKSADCYRRSFNYVVQRIKDISNYDVKNKGNKLRIAAFDFEKAERNEFTKAFKVDTTWGCLYHFSKNLKKNWKLKGLEKFMGYETKNKHGKNIYISTEFGKNMRTIKCLSLLPIGKVPGAWKDVKKKLQKSLEYDELIQNDNDISTKLNTFIDYFENTYIFEHATFPPSDWNFYRNHQRTQGLKEREHLEWKQLMGEYHPTIDRFVNTLKIIEQETDLELRRLIRYRNTTEPTQKIPKERAKEQILHILWDLYDANHIRTTSFLKLSSMTVSNRFDLLKGYINNNTRRRRRFKLVQNIVNQLTVRHQ